MLLQNVTYVKFFFIIRLIDKPDIHNLAHIFKSLYMYNL